jgi:hypothetical protein
MNAHARRVIRVEAGQIDILSTQAEDELIGSGLPVFQRGGMLVRPTAWEVPASDDRHAGGCLWTSALPYANNAP